MVKELAGSMYEHPIFMEKKISLFVYFVCFMHVVVMRIFPVKMLLTVIRFIIIGLMIVWHAMLITMFGTDAAAGEVADQNGLRILDAVRITLGKQPDILIQSQEVLALQGMLDQQAGVFDTTLNAGILLDHENYPLNSISREAYQSSSQAMDSTTYRLGLSRQLRSGIKLTPGLSTAVTATDPPDVDPVGAGRVDFLVTLPLLQGKGETVVTADERSAAMALEAGRMTLLHTVSQKIYDVMVAYWTVVLNKLNLEELIASETRATRMLSDYKELVQADERPAGDLQQLAASLFEKTAARIAGEQSLYEAHQSLGLDMGVAKTELDMLPWPSDTFHGLTDSQTISISDPSGELLSGTLTRRMDYQSSRKNQEQKQIQVVAARDKLKPQLDLNVNLGYSGLDEGKSASTYVTPLFQQVPGLSVYVGLNYTFPVANTSARGIVTQRQAELRQAEIQCLNLERSISFSLSVALRDLRNTSEQLSRFSQSVTAYRQATANEAEKFKLGMSTLLDVITMEDRLTQSRLNEIQAQANLALAIARLRFETGMIVVTNGNSYSIIGDDLNTPPKINHERPQS